VFPYSYITAFKFYPINTKGHIGANMEEEDCQVVVTRNELVNRDVLLMVRLVLSLFEQALLTSIADKYC
jgi:hypothetical protein